MAINFNTENQTFRKIMGNGIRYSVPRFQRDYTWDAEQWDDLWQDIENRSEEEDQHYMGYLVLQTSKNGSNLIIDGQQRITTISIIIIAVLYQLKELIEADEDADNNRKRLETLQASFIGFVDPVSLASQPKLELNRNNDALFRNYLCALETPPIRRVKKSERLLIGALKFFREKIASNIENNGSSLAQFIEEIIDYLLFTTITVGSELNAYKVFETLNARGVQLSVPDLIKNYLFSTIDSNNSIHDEEIRRLDDDWSFITAQLGKHDFSKFVHAHWISHKPYTPKKQLFKRIKEDISSREKAHAYLADLRNSVEVYAALQDPDDEFWDQDELIGASKKLKTLSMFNVTQPHSVLLSAYNKFTKDRFIKVIGYFEVVAIRYNVIGGGAANEQERLYNKIARDIFDGKIANLSSIKDRLKEICPSDEKFLSDFRLKNMRTAQSPKKVRYLLAEIENCIRGASVDDETYTLEHILPQNPDAEWVEYFGNEDIDNCIDRIGNTTLLSKKDNKINSRDQFSEKKKTLEKSKLHINEQIIKYEDWNKAALEEHQSWLGEQACKRWKIEFDK